jgi:hypothetical protein
MPDRDPPRLAPLTDPRRSLDDLIERRPELLPYTMPMSAGNGIEIAAKLDEIIELLRRLAVNGR